MSSITYRTSWVYISKQYNGRANYESTDYSSLQDYIDAILKGTAIKRVAQ